MADETNTSASSFLSEDTERKIAEFTKKLEAEQASLPDTSIRSGTGALDAPQNYYFDGDENIPIYNSALNKRIDRVDMEVDKAKRMRRTHLADEVDRYAREIHARNAAQERAASPQATPEEGGKRKVAPFIYVFPIILVIFGIVVIVAMSL